MCEPNSIWGGVTHHLMSLFMLLGRSDTHKQHSSPSFLLSYLTPVYCQGLRFHPICLFPILKLPHLPVPVETPTEMTSVHYRS